MCPRVDKQPLLPRFQSKGAKDLGLFAPHHVRDAAGSEMVEARYYVDLADALRVDRLEARREIAHARRAMHVGYFDPTLAAADHAGHDDRERAVLRNPWTDPRSQHLGEPPRLDRQNTVRALHIREYASGLVDEIGSEIARAPIDGDQARLSLHGRLPLRCASSAGHSL